MVSEDWIQTEGLFSVNDTMWSARCPLVVHTVFNIDFNLVIYVPLATQREADIKSRNQDKLYRQHTRLVNFPAIGIHTKSS